MERELDRAEKIMLGAGFDLPSTTKEPPIKKEKTSEPDTIGTVNAFSHELTRGMIPALKAVDWLYEKFTGNKSRQQKATEDHPLAATIGKAIPDIVNSTAIMMATGGSPNSVLQKAIPKAGGGVVGTLANMLRGAAIGAPSSVIASQAVNPDPSLDSVKNQALWGGILGSAEGLVQPMQKAGSGLLATVLKRSNKARNIERQMGETIEDFAVRKGPWFATTPEGLASRSEKAIQKIEKALAPLYEKEIKVSSDKVIKELQDLKSAYMDTRGVVKPTMKAEAKLVDDAIKYVDENFGIGKEPLMAEARGLKSQAQEAGKKAALSNEMGPAKEEIERAIGSGWRKAMIAASDDPNFANKALEESKLITLKQAANTAAQNGQKSFLWRLALPAALGGGYAAHKYGGDEGDLGAGALGVALMAHPAGRLTFANALAAAAKIAQNMKYAAPELSEALKKPEK